VAMFIVDGFEVIQIDEHQRHRSCRSTLAPM
jgi:hypothetical protein